MKKLFVIALALCLAPLGMAQVNDVSPSFGQTATLAINNTNALGDFLWSLDVEGPTGDIRCLGVEFDGTNYWVTGAFDMTIAYLYEIDPNGNLINTFTQPTANWGGWGWRDLAYDGAYLYTGDPNAGYIDQIDPATGTPTGVRYGPFPVTPCRALAYDANTDSFWTASFSSSIYQCFKNGTYNTYSNPGLSMYGAAIEASDPANPMLWWWSQDGSFGCLATEMNPATGTTTGNTFEGDPGVGGIAGGACAYDAGGGMWHLVGLAQASPDTIAAYDLNTVGMPFECDTKVIESWVGGTANFKLDAGVANAGRYYAIFGSATGSTPGFNLPGGGANVPVNWDSFTNILLLAALPGFIGPLDGNGQATASLYLPHFQLGSDLNLTFAYGLAGPPWDYASNPVEILVKAWAPMYAYDDGSCENILGWTSGGEICFMHPFDSGPGDTITKASNTYGSTTYPGYGPGNGTATTVFMWDDPTNDMNPTDCVLKDMVGSTIQNEDLDIFVDTNFTVPQNVTGIFFIGVNVPHSAGMYVCPIDMDTPPPTGTTWYAGGVAGVFDYNNIANNTVGQYTSGPWLLRAIP